MPTTRALAPELHAALTACRRLEWLAVDDRQQHAAIQATARLMREAFDLGWTSVQIGAAVGMSDNTVRARIADVRRREATPLGLALDEPVRQPDQTATLRVAVSEREWLTLREAAEFAGVSLEAAKRWLSAGILPNARKLGRRNLILRADLLRAMRAPRYNTRGVLYAAVREEISRNGV